MSTVNAILVAANFKVHCRNQKKLQKKYMVKTLLRMLNKRYAYLYSICINIYAYIKGVSFRNTKPFLNKIHRKFTVIFNDKTA